MPTSNHPHSPEKWPHHRFRFKRSLASIAHKMILGNDATFTPNRIFCHSNDKQTARSHTNAMQEVECQSIPTLLPVHATVALGNRCGLQNAEDLWDEYTGITEDDVRMIKKLKDELLASCTILYETIHCLRLGWQRSIHYTDKRQQIQDAILQQMYNDGFCVDTGIMIVPIAKKRTWADEKTAVKEKGDHEAKKQCIPVMDTVQERR